MPEETNKGECSIQDFLGVLDDLILLDGDCSLDASVTLQSIIDRRNMLLRKIGQ